MSLKYAIISIDDSRATLREAAASKLEDSGFEPLPVPTGIYVDGRVPGAIQREIDECGWEITGSNFHNGELGIWFSNLNTFERSFYTRQEYLLVLEDDAVVMPVFEKIAPLVLDELPVDCDFFAWAIPNDQKVDYYYNRVFNSAGGWEIVSHQRHRYTGSPHYIGANFVCKAYQGYHAVAMMYTKEGMRKILDLVRQQGIRTAFDLFLFEEHHKGNLNGYTLLPDVYPAIVHQETGTIARNSGMFN